MRRWTRSTSLNHHRARQVSTGKPAKELPGQWVILVHPPGLRLTVLFVAIRYAWAAVVAIFVEVVGAVMLAHVHFKLFRRLLPFVTVVAIAGSEIHFGEEGLNTPPRHKLDVDPSEQCAAQVSEISDPLAFSCGAVQCAHQSNENPDRHHVTCFHGEREWEH